MQWPVTLLTAAALVDSLAFVLASHYNAEDETRICKCKAFAKSPVSEDEADEIHLYEASKSVDDVIEDIRDVLHLSPVGRILLASTLTDSMACRWNWMNVESG